MFESSSFMCERVIKITEVSLFSKLDRHRVSKSQGELLSDSSSDLKASRGKKHRHNLSALHIQPLLQQRNKIKIV